MMSAERRALIDLANDLVERLAFNGNGTISYDQWDWDRIIAALRAAARGPQPARQIVPLALKELSARATVGPWHKATHFVRSERWGIEICSKSDGKNLAFIAEAANFVRELCKAEAEASAAESLEPPGCPTPGACSCPGGEAEMAKRLAEANRDRETLRARAERAEDDLAKQAAVFAKKTECTMGVGDGGGQLFVHGDFESIKSAQALVFRAGRAARMERERDEAIARAERAEFELAERDARVVAAEAPAQRDDGVLQDDLREMLELLEMPAGARPDSPHQVFQDALSVLRERIKARNEEEALWVGRGGTGKYLIVWGNVESIKAVQAIIARAEAADAKITELKDKLGDPDGTVAHADVLIRRADENRERAEAAEDRAERAEELAKRFHGMLDHWLEAYGEATMPWPVRIWRALRKT